MRTFDQIAELLNGADEAAKLAIPQFDFSDLKYAAARVGFKVVELATQLIPPSS